MVKVTVVRMGHEAKELSLETSATFADALSNGGIEASNSDGLRVNGKPADLDSTVREGDFITYNPKVSGGR
jgi:hypothetical protein